MAIRIESLDLALLYFTQKPLPYEHLLTSDEYNKRVLLGSRNGRTIEVIGDCRNSSPTSAILQLCVDSIPIMQAGVNYDQGSVIVKYVSIGVYVKGSETVVYGGHKFEPNCINSLVYNPGGHVRSLSLLDEPVEPRRIRRLVRHGFYPYSKDLLKPLDVKATACAFGGWVSSLLISSGTISRRINVNPVLIFERPQQFSK